MTLETTGGYAIFGVNMTPTMRLSLGETLQRFEVDRGGVPGLPFTGDLFPDLPGVEGATIHAQRVALIHDSRDSLITPTRGALRRACSPRPPPSSWGATPTTSRRAPKAGT